MQKQLLHTLPAFSLLLATILLFPVSASTKKEQTAVEKCFKLYSTAIMANNGAQALACIDKNTLTYYNSLMKSVQHADSTTLEKLPLMEKLSVIMLRHRLTPEEILSLNGEKLFIYALTNGMIGSEMTNTTLGDITITGTLAKGQLLVDKEPSAIFMQFQKEGGEWKIDLTALFKVSSLMLEDAHKKSGMTEHEFIATVIKSATGKAPTPSVWKPLKK